MKLFKVIIILAVLLIPVAGVVLEGESAESSQINVNTANQFQLMELKGVGRTMADRIVTYRREHGPFETLEDLTQIKGIGGKRLEKIREGEVPPAQLGLCPKCGQSLSARNVDDVDIDECAACGGIWLDKGELEQIVSRESEGWASRWVRSVLAGK